MIQKGQVSKLIRKLVEEGELVENAKVFIDQNYFFDGEGFFAFVPPQDGEKLPDKEAREPRQDQIEKAWDFLIQNPLVSFLLRDKREKLLKKWRVYDC